MRTIIKVFAFCFLSLVAISGCKTIEVIKTQDHYIHDTTTIYIQKCQLAMMRQGDMIGSDWNYEERVRLNQQEFEILKKLNNIYQKLKES